MRHTDEELQALKNDINQMWNLVISQLKKAKLSLLNDDKELALEVISREKRVNALELRLDNKCENYIALFCPVAIDLRLIISILKIANTLERIGDFAVGIAHHVNDNNCDDVDKKLIVQSLQFEKMLDIVIGMLSDCLDLLNQESTQISGKILARDKEVDRIYHNIMQELNHQIQETPSIVACGFELLLLARKIERIGDHCSNIVEEIVFYVDAKVLKHGGYKEK